MDYQNITSVADLLNLLKTNGIEDSFLYKILLGMTIDPDKDATETFWDVAMPMVILNKLVTSSFPKASEEVDGEIRFAISENGKPVGINLEECHFLIAGQTGTGKSTLLKIIFASALLVNERHQQ